MRSHSRPRPAPPPAAGPGSARRAGAPGGPPDPLVGPVRDQLGQAGAAGGVGVDVERTSTPRSTAHSRGGSRGASAPSWGGRLPCGGRSAPGRRPARRSRSLRPWPGRGSPLAPDVGEVQPLVAAQDATQSHQLLGVGVAAGGVISPLDIPKAPAPRASSSSASIPACSSAPGGRKSNPIVTLRNVTCPARGTTLTAGGGPHPGGRGTRRTSARSAPPRGDPPTPSGP